MRRIEFHEVNLISVIGCCPADLLSGILDVLHPDIESYADIRYILQSEIYTKSKMTNQSFTRG